MSQVLGSYGAVLNGLADAVRVLLEKSWALGLLLLIVGSGVWLAAAHGQPLPKHVAEWAVPGALLGFALIVLSIVTTALESIGAKVSTRRARRKRESDEAEEAQANLQTLDAEEWVALSTFIQAGATRASVDVESLLASVCRKGVLRAVRKHDYRHITVEIPEAILALSEDIKQGAEEIKEKGLVRQMNM